jgi:serine phosphatase RsbU (regulator of sigma subunit)
MAPVNKGAISALHYETATSTLPGNARSGDLEVVYLHAGGALLAVIDGVGHGDSAALAADHARRAIESHRLDPPATILRRCHEALRGTRGVVMSIAAVDFERGMLSWLGVGNVRGVLHRSGSAAQSRGEELLLRPGLVGAQLPILQPTLTPLGRGDTLIFATDGVRSDFVDMLIPFAKPRTLAPRILAQFGRSTDDALVLVAQLS